MLLRSVACAFTLPFFFGAALYAQVAKEPAFEVATIKPIPPTAYGNAIPGNRVDGSRLDIGIISLNELIVTAYGVKANQIAGPDWLYSQLFEIHAKIPEGAAKNEIPKMLQTLLAERFKVAIHREDKEQRVYALTVPKGGSKLKEAVPETVDPSPTRNSVQAPHAGNADKNAVHTITMADGRAVVLPGKQSSRRRTSVDKDGNIITEYSKIGMKEFADLLTRYSDRPVVDMTELKGFYQVVLEVSREEQMNAMRKDRPDLPLESRTSQATPSADGLGELSPPDPPGRGIFRSVEQLGLKLESRKVPIEMLVIDHIEKSPTEN